MRRTIDIPVEEIKTNRYQPRLEFEEGAGVAAGQQETEEDLEDAEQRNAFDGLRTYTDDARKAFSDELRSYANYGQEAYNRDQQTFAEDTQAFRATEPSDANQEEDLQEFAQQGQQEENASLSDEELAMMQ